MEKIIVALLAGGDSSEYDISVQGARFITSILNKDKYIPYIVFVKQQNWYVELLDGGKAYVNKDDFSFKTTDDINIKFQYSLILIHGTPGENGILQAYFELMRVPYSTCKVCSSAVTFDKYLCKRSVETLGVALSKDMLLRRSDKIDVDRICDELSLPLFVKSNASGSSFGVTKVKDKKDIISAINHALTEGDSVIIEETVNGIEVSCGIMKIKGEHIIFPATEIVSQNEYFDFDAKYKGLSQEITPARISSKERKALEDIMPKIYDRLDCRGLVRIDFIISDGVPYMIEINTVPGMSSQSIIPQEAKAMGLSMTDMFDMIIEETIK